MVGLVSVSEVRAVVWMTDSKTPNGIAEVPLTDLARDAFREQIRISGPGPWLFPNAENPAGHQKTLKTVWHAVLRRAKVLARRGEAIRALVELAAIAEGASALRSRLIEEFQKCPDWQLASGIVARALAEESRSQGEARVGAAPPGWMPPVL
jgi:integrase